MAHFAEIDPNNIVLRVLVVPDEFESKGQDYLANQIGLGGTWIQTSYNGNIRKNYAGIGFEYDAYRDAFIAPKPDCHPKTILFDEESCQWHCTTNHTVEEGLNLER
jgi:hypothetical protein